MSRKKQETKRPKSKSRDYESVVDSATFVIGSNSSAVSVTDIGLDCDSSLPDTHTDDSVSVCDSTIIPKEYEEDGPSVFFCTKCKLIVGDSFSWAGSDEVHSQIVLKRVCENVLVGKKPRLSEVSGEEACLLADLICRGCDTVLGQVYRSTPKELDHKRSLYFLNVLDIQNYVLGSSGRQEAPVKPEEKPVSLEYVLDVEQRLAALQDFVLAMGQNLVQLEKTQATSRGSSREAGAAGAQ